MKQKIKYGINTILEKIDDCIITLSVFPAVLTSVVCSKAGLFGSNSLENGVSALASLYTEKLFLLLLLFDGFLYIITKDEKKKKIEEKALIGILAFYVICKLASGTWIQSTLDTIVGWFSS